MASPRGESESWSTKARGSSADEPGAGSNLEQTGPLFDPLEGSFAPPIVPTGKTPPPPERERPARPQPREPFDHTEPFEPKDEPIYAPPKRRMPPPGRRPRRVRQVRRVKRTLRHIDPLSVLKVSLMFYGVFLLIWLGVVAVIYWIVQGAGLFDQINALREALGEKATFELSLSFVEKWAFFIGLGISIFMALVNLFLAVLYNIVADTIGGIDMTFVERD